MVLLGPCSWEYQDCVSLFTALAMKPLRYLIRWFWCFGTIVVGTLEVFVHGHFILSDPGERESYGLWGGESATVVQLVQLFGIMELEGEKLIY